MNRTVVGQLLNERKEALFRGAVALIFLAGLFIDHGRSSFPTMPMPSDLSAYKKVTADADIEDNMWHHLVAVNVSEGHGISVSVEPPYKPTMFRSPGPAVVTGISYFLVGRTNTKYVFAALYLGSFFLLALAVRRLFGMVEALCFTVILSLFDASTHLWASAMHFSAGPPAFFFISLFVYMAARSIDDLGAATTGTSRRLIYGNYFLTGAATAAVILCRAEFLFLPLVTGALILLSRSAAKSRGFRIEMILLVFVLGIAALYGPWMVRNYVQFNTLSPGGRGGLAIAHRGLGAKAVSEGMDYWNFHRVFYLDDFGHALINKWRDAGYTQAEMINLEKQAGYAGMRLIKEHFWSYLRGSWEEFKCGQAFNPTSLSVLGDRARSYFQKMSNTRPFYSFAILSFFGMLLYFARSPLKTAMMFHIAFYYFLINSVVNTLGCYYTTYMLELYYAAFSLLAAAVLRALFKLWQGSAPLPDHSSE